MPVSSIRAVVCTHEEIIHSDLKAVRVFISLVVLYSTKYMGQDNVLVSPSGQPLLTDFGISRILVVKSPLSAAYTSSGDALRV